MGIEGNYKVTTTAKHVVAAAVPLQDHTKLPLSNLDLLLPNLDVNIFFCYKNNNINVSYDNNDRNGQQECSTFKAKVSILKKALAQALAYFYPFAGEIVINSAGEPEILCNNRGVEFIEASADVELCALDLYNPDESIEGKLVPKKKDGIFSVQVTKLRCGGTVVACAFDHRVADAYSANMFWVTWAEIATLKPISSTPNLQRSIFKSRDPLVYYNDSYDEMFLPISSLHVSNPNELQKFDPLITRLYFISKYHLDSLQSLCIDDEASGKKYSKLQCFSAFLWQIIASQACQLGVDYTHKFSMMGIVVDGRTRLSYGKSKDKEQALASYFGNVLTIASGEKTCGELKEMPISKLVKLVHGFLEKPTTKDHFLGLIDWVEAHRPEPGITKIYCTKEDDGPAFVVSSGLRFPISKMDFGWGNAIFGSYHFPWGGNCGYVMPMPSPSENGDWIVYMHLREEQLDYIEAVTSDMFKLISLDMINDC